MVQKGHSVESNGSFYLWETGLSRKINYIKKIKVYVDRCW